MTKLERLGWSSLPCSIQETIHASQLVEDPATMDLGPTRPVSIGEVLAWSKLHGVTFAAHVVETLNPNHCLVAKGGVGVRHKLHRLRKKAKDLSMFLWLKVW
jgi:hypothetical protein